MMKSKDFIPFLLPFLIITTFEVGGGAAEKLVQNVFDDDGDGFVRFNLVGQTGEKLICYPSRIESGENAKLAKRFGKGDSMDGQKLVDECEKVAGEDKKPGKKWSGLKLKWLDGKMMEIETSFGAKCTISEPINQFMIRLADGTIHGKKGDNADPMPLTCVPENGKMGEFADDQRDGAFLEDYAGLWIMAIDLGNETFFLTSSDPMTTTSTTTTSTTTPAPTTTSTTSTSTTTPTPTTIRPSIPLPFTDHFHFMVLKSVVIEAEIKADAQSFNIALLQDAPMYEEKVGATAMRLHANFITGKMTISSYKYKHPTDKDKAGGNEFEEQKLVEENPFQQGETYEVTIDVLEKHFSIKANGKEIAIYEHKIPPANINWLRVDGDIMLFTKPSIDTIQPDEDIYTMKLERLLHQNDRITFSGYTPDKAKEFSIYFMNGSPDPDDRNHDTILRTVFAFMESSDESDEFVGAFYFKHEINEWKQYENAEGRNELITNVPFTLTFHVFERGFILKDDALNKVILEVKLKDNKVKGDNKYNVFPTWAVNYILVKGDVRLTKKPKIDYGQQPNIKPVDVPLKAGIGLESGDVIIIKGVMPRALDADKPVNVDEGDNVNAVSISLFNDALGYNERFGYTVLSVELWLHRLSTRSMYKNSMFIYAKPVVDKNVTIRIELAETSYNVTISEDGTGKALIEPQHKEASLPFWAIQYIVVDGKFDMHGEIEVVKNSKVQ